MKKNGIKRGVSLYSYQEEYFLRKMTLEDCIAAVAKMGADGVELLGEQMLPGEFPWPSDAFVEKWFGWMKKYKTTPTAMDGFLDTKLYKNRLLTTRECVQMMERDIRLCNRLGFTVLRTLCSTPCEVIERSLPCAEENGVKIGLEIHAPFSLKSAWIEAYMEMLQRTGTRHFGIVPDMGIFVRRFPPCIQEWWIRHGAQERIVRHVAAAYEARAAKDAVKAGVEKMGGEKPDLDFAEMAFHFSCDDPRWLARFMPHVIHVHAKFYEMTPECTDPSILYDEVVPLLIEGGYDGWLSSEYEGNRHIQDACEVDSVEQVRRQHVMFTRLLGEK